MDPETIDAIDAESHVSPVLEQVRRGKRFRVVNHRQRADESNPENPHGGVRRTGRLRGRIRMAPRFDDPLDDFKEYMP